jgi:precorrin-6x reductase
VSARILLLGGTTEALLLARRLGPTSIYSSPTRHLRIQWADGKYGQPVMTFSG